jgi:hypothetical protein
MHMMLYFLDFQMHCLPPGEGGAGGGGVGGGGVGGVGGVA